mgnify:CR=1 FL=1
MVKMTNELFEKFSKKQEELDSVIREKRNISLEEWNSSNRYFFKHMLALINEKNEFINECRDIWKYWKTKQIVPEKLIDEAVDVIHCMHLIDNKKSSHEWFSIDVSTINEVIKRVKASGKMEFCPEEVLFHFEKTDDLNEIYGRLLSILDHYAFTLHDIEVAYDNKNKENHKRQKNNY